MTTNKTLTLEDVTPIAQDLDNAKAHVYSALEKAIALKLSFHQLHVLINAGNDLEVHQHEVLSFVERQDQPLRGRALAQGAALGIGRPLSGSYGCRNESYEQVDASLAMRRQDYEDYQRGVRDALEAQAQLELLEKEPDIAEDHAKY